MHFGREMPHLLRKMQQIYQILHISYDIPDYGPFNRISKDGLTHRGSGLAYLLSLSRFCMLLIYLPWKLLLNVIQ